ncbi:hypothetical protein ACF0H5_013797 [Mactra antiquata]
MYAELTQLTKRVNELEIKDEILLKENEELKARIEVLESTTQQQQKELVHLKNIQSDSTYDVPTTEEHPTKSSIRRSSFPTINRQATHQSNRIQRIRKYENEMTVAFFSKLANSITNTGVHQQIVFEQVVTNVGNGYNKFSGDFRAPVRGVYAFSTTIKAMVQPNASHFQYLLNGAALSNLYIAKGDTISQQVVLDLQQGDTVALHSVVAGHDIFGYGHSTFSGFLLQQNYDTPAVVG